MSKHLSQAPFNKERRSKDAGSSRAKKASVIKADNEPSAAPDVGSSPPPTPLTIVKSNKKSEDKKSPESSDAENEAASFFAKNNLPSSESESEIEDDKW